MQKVNRKSLKYETSGVLAVIKNKDSDKLQILYSEYSARMRHSGGMIWQIGSIFIPLSLSGIVLGFEDFLRVLAVGCFSIFLIWTWYFISVAIDNALERDLAICGTIETILLNLEKMPLKRGLNELIKQSSGVKSPRLRTIRLVIPVLITFGWTGVAILSYLATP